MYRYKKVKLKDGTTRDEHRIIMEKKLGRKLKFNECVHHVNGNGKDNRECNLKVVIRNRHTGDHFRGKKLRKEHVKKISENRRGEKQIFSKLKEKDVIEIRIRLKEGARGVDLAQEFGVKRAAISNVKSRRNWKHI